MLIHQTMKECNPPHPPTWTPHRLNTATIASAAIRTITDHTTTYPSMSTKSLIACTTAHSLHSKPDTYSTDPPQSCANHKNTSPLSPPVPVPFQCVPSLPPPYNRTACVTHIYQLAPFVKYPRIRARALRRGVLGSLPAGIAFESRSTGGPVRPGSADGRVEAPRIGNDARDWPGIMETSKAKTTICGSRGPGQSRGYRVLTDCTSETRRTLLRIITN